MATVRVKAFDVTSAHYSQIFHGKLFTSTKKTQPSQLISS